MLPRGLAWMKELTEKNSPERHLLHGYTHALAGVHKNYS